MKIKAFYNYIKGKKMISERGGPIRDQAGNLCAEPERLSEILILLACIHKDQDKDIVVEEFRKGCGEIQIFHGICASAVLLL